MNRQDITRQEYEALCDEIWMHNRAYFQEGAPKISDDAYDQLYLFLERIEEAHPDWVSPTSPSKRVGEAPLEAFPEVQHSKPMLSLEKAFHTEDLEAFYVRLGKLLDTTKFDLYAQPKIDGLAVSLIYEKGQFVRAVTRGDGLIGSDISANCKTIERLPLRIKPLFTYLEVRGEVYMNKHQFYESNKERERQGLPLFANPRNAAAGSLKLLDSRELSKRSNLDIVFYGIAAQEPLCIKYQHEINSILSDVGLPTLSNIPNVSIPLTKLLHNVQEMISFAEEIRSKRADLPFHIDGVVFKLDSIDASEAIVPTNKHPRTAIAWKFTAEQAWTELNDITVQVGRTGVITPVAELQAVELDGSTVQRATLHNFDEIQRKDIRIKDRVLIEKGGDIIPKVVLVDSSKKDRSPPWSFPKNCPSCGHVLTHDSAEVAIRCLNHAGCPEQRIKEIIYFAGKDGLDIENIGDKLVRQLYEKGYIRYPSDLFSLTREQLLSLDGIKEKSAKNILKSLLDAKTPALEDLIMALGIRHVGKGTARELAKKRGSLELFLESDYDTLMAIDGLGEKTVQSILERLKSQELLEELHRLTERGVVPKVTHLQSQSFNESHPFFGASIALTGVLHTMSRTEAARAIESVGGTFSDTVSRKTDYVVVGDEYGSKRDKAIKLGIKILNETEFVAMIQS